ncbi:MAG TPA: nucleoside phosphorylase [Nitrososphaerales archaeon]|nr:nucleoside phosphorylase [Nitrososphaerales archaeon]
MANEPRGGNGRLYHVNLGKGDVGRIALLPGDPDRVPEIARRFKKARVLSSHREYTACGGYVGKEYVVVMSTGIGGPATAIAVEELARLGVKVMVRVGTCGAISRRARVGSVLIPDASVRMEGTSSQYVPAGYPAAASPEVVLSLRDAAVALKKPFTLGTVASTDSFYVGQGRKSYGGYFPSENASLIRDLSSANVLGFEMECATLFTLARVFGLKSGAVLAVVANRVTDEFRAGAGVDAAIDVAIESVRRFSKLGV